MRATDAALEGIMTNYIGLENDIFWLAGNEAKAGDVVNDNMQNSATFNKTIKDRIDGIVKRATKQVDEELTKLQSKTKVLASQAKAFDTEYNSMKNNYQPQKSISIVNYQYDTGVLDAQMTAAKGLFLDAYNKFSGFVNNPDRIKAKNNILGADYRRVVSGIMDKFNAPKDITTTEGLYTYTRERFRGKKQQMNLGSGAITRYYAETRNIQGIINSTTQALQDVKNKLVNISRILDGFIRSMNTTQEHKSALPKVVRNFVSLANFYIGMIMYCFELRIEKVVNSRIVVKTFYKKETSKEGERQKRIEGEVTNDEG